MVRVSRPTASGRTGGRWGPREQPAAGGATAPTMSAASQAMRRAVSGWIGPTRAARPASHRRHPERGRAHREGEMRALAVDIAVVPAAQLGGGQLDECVGTALRAAGLVMGHPLTERVDGGLHQRAAFGVELPAKDEDPAIRLLALEPAPLMGAVVVGEHPMGWIRSRATWVTVRMSLGSSVPPRPPGCAPAAPPAPRRHHWRAGRSWSRCSGRRARHGRCRAWPGAREGAREPDADAPAFQVTAQ